MPDVTVSKKKRWEWQVSARVLFCVALVAWGLISMAIVMIS